ncbi:hypothetical protein Hanom_Chr10g00885841 [Helianthus anomalus]
MFIQINVSNLIYLFINSLQSITLSLLQTHTIRDFRVLVLWLEMCFRFVTEDLEDEHWLISQK